MSILLSNIETGITYNSEQWTKARRGKITSSKVSEIICEKSHEGKFTAKALEYIESRVWEITTGTDYYPDISNRDSTMWGNEHEPQAIKVFSEKSGHVMFHSEDDKNGNWSTHRLLHINEFSTSTPDALVAYNPSKPFSEDNQSLNAFPLEIKSPFKKYVTFLNRLKTPKDLKILEKDYYWQVLHQMLAAKSVSGYFAVFDPRFTPKGQEMTFVKFTLNDKDINNDYIKLVQSLSFAVETIKSLL